MVIEHLLYINILPGKWEICVCVCVCVYIYVCVCVCVCVCVSSWFTQFTGDLEVNFTKEVKFTLLSMNQNLEIWLVLAIVQFSSIAQSCLILCNPMNRSMPGLPVDHQLLEFTKTHVHRVGDAIQPFHPLSSPSPPAPNPSQHQGLFQWVNSSHKVGNVLEFQPQHQYFPMNTQDWSPLGWTGWISWQFWPWEQGKMHILLVPNWHSSCCCC